MEVKEEEQSQSAEPASQELGLEFTRSWHTSWGFYIKLILMGIINALGLWAAWRAFDLKSYVIMAGALLILILADWIYFSKRTIPAKYLFPGLVFLAVFQVFVFIYTGYASFTNYGFRHMGSQEQAINAAMIQNEREVPGSERYPLTILEKGDEVAFGIVKNGQAWIGTDDQPLQEDADATVAKDKITAAPGWEVMPLNKVLTDTALQQTVTKMRVPVSDDPESGSLRTRDGATAITTRSSLIWDAEAQTLTDTDSGEVYHATSDGVFRADDGTELSTGWVVGVGFKNFTKVFTQKNLAGPMLQITIWTFVFALLTVLMSFALGLLFALVFNDDRVKGKKILRTLFILPYAFPAFMSALLWKGMLNAEFGVINKWFFFGAQIDWLGDPWLAKIAVLFVNLWLGYPYWFLVTTGALQAIPDDVIEASVIDGAGAWRRFRSVTLPLLLVSTAPLAISSFAFNFNNFNLIYMLTGGGPVIPGSPNTLGNTDVLISAIYKISGVSGGTADYGFASALSILVFIIVGVISAISFRQTRKLEEYA